MKKERILFILPFIPYPLITGGHQAIFNGIKSLIENYDLYITYESKWDVNDKEEINSLQNVLGKSVTILPYKCPKPDNTENSNSFIHKIHIFLWLIKIHLYKIILPTKKDNKNNLTIWQGEYLPKNEEQVKFINNIISKYNINIVQCEMLQTASYVLTLPNIVKKIFVHHEIGFVREELNVMAKVKNYEIYKETLDIVKKNEIAILNKFDAIITLSKIDSKKLIEAGVNIPIYTSFAIVNCNPNLDNKSERHHILTFIGPSCHEPNVIGIKWFLKNCWKDLRAINSDYCLQIIGKWDKSISKNIKKEYPNIHFKGFVEDLHSEIRNTIMIVPITVGSGIRMKILEACMSGIPVISTSIGAEGLPLTHNKDILIADSPNDFISAITKLKDKDTRLKLIQSSREKIIKDYSINALKVNRETILKSIIN